MRALNPKRIDENSRIKVCVGTYVFELIALFDRRAGEVIVQDASQ